MKPSKRFGRFGCVPLDLDAAWLRLPHYAQLIGKDLMARADSSAAELRVSIDLRDWQGSVCKLMCIDGRCRQAARAMLNRLHAEGLLTLGPSWVQVNLRRPYVEATPTERRGDADTTSTVRRHDVDRTSSTSQILGITQITIDRIEENREEESRSERVREESAAPTLPDVAAEAHRRTFAQVGAERLNSVDRRLRIRAGRDQDSSLEEIGSAPAEDWEVVKRMLASEIAKGNARYITPRAVARHWATYATGTVPGQPRPPAGVLPGANYKPASAPDPNYKRQEDHPTLARLLSAAGAASKAVAT